MVNSRAYLDINRPSHAPRIFLTGASGCVGSYLLSTLLHQTNASIFALIRQPEKLAKQIRNHPRIHILAGDLASISQWQTELAQTEIMIHAAVQWGGKGIYQINQHQTLQLLNCLDPQVCRQIFYFSTASLLGREGQFCMRTVSAGTDYIRSKAACYLSLKQSIWQPKLRFLYPTVVLGGDHHHPYSAASEGLTNLHDWMPWLRHLKAQGIFHWIHAEDIATLVKNWIWTPPPVQDLILGNPPQSVNQIITELIHYTQTPKGPQLPLEWFFPILLPLLSKQMSDWDRHSLRTRFLVYNTYFPERLGLSSRFKDLAAVLKSLDIPKKQTP